MDHHRGHHQPSPPFMGSKSLLQLLALYLQWLVLFSHPAAGSGRMCEKSGYCSTEHVKPWIGDLAPPGALRSALEARTYRKELILIFALDNRLVGLVQAWHDMKQQGYGHVLPMLPSEHSCRSIARHHPDFACAWSSDYVTWYNGNGYLNLLNTMQALRYIVATRAARLGYNVLNMDIDVFFLNDPYYYFKHPLLQHYNLIVQNEEMPWQLPGTNVGVMYLQNAAPNGPAAWVMHDVAERTLRWSEENFAHLKSKSPPIIHMCALWEQNMVFDTLWSTLMERPLFPYGLGQCAGAGQGPAKFIHHLDYVNITQRLNVTRVPTPPDMLAVIRFPNFTLDSLVMRMPNAKGQWPEELGGFPYAAARGPMSRLYLQQLQSDSPSAPMWPDPLDPAQAAAARAIPPEHYLIGPEWLVGTWRNRGRQGEWEERPACAKVPGSAEEVRAGAGVPPALSPSKTVPPGTVIGHIHRTDCSSEAHVAKSYIALAYGHWRWNLTRQMMGQHVYYASTHQRAVPHVVAYSPHLDFTKLTKGPGDFKLMLRALAKVAMLTGRTAAWPALRCSSPFWTGSTSPPHRPPNPCTFHLTETERVSLGVAGRPDMFATGPLSNLSCVWSPLMSTGCVKDFTSTLTGMLPLELEHYMQEDISNWDEEVLLVKPGEHLTGEQQEVTWGPEEEAHWKGVYARQPGLPFVLEPKTLPANVAMMVTTEEAVVALGRAQQGRKLWLLDAPIDVALVSNHSRSVWDKVIRGNCWPMISVDGYWGPCRN